MNRAFLRDWDVAFLNNFQEVFFTSFFFFFKFRRFRFREFLVVALLDGWRKWRVCLCNANSKGWTEVRVNWVFFKVNWRKKALRFFKKNASFNKKDRFFGVEKLRQKEDLRLACRRPYRRRGDRQRPAGSHRQHHAAAAPAGG